MSESIAAYGLIGDLHTAALISESGNLAWLCWPDFDSEACFAALLGTDDNGSWTLAPRAYRERTRRYLPGTLVLETRYRKLGSELTVTDFMPIRDGRAAVVRIVRCLKGRFPMRTCFAPRLDYGHVQPLLRKAGPDSWWAVSGRHQLILQTPVELRCEDGDLLAEWTAEAGRTYAFVLQHDVSYQPGTPDPLRPEAAQRATVEYWNDWLKHSTYTGSYRDAVERSLITLHALTYKPSGGFVAAPTAALPEKVGGVRNWDYRYCWLRDTIFSLKGMQDCGFEKDAEAWMNWFGRAIQGNPAGLRILYGITGRREHGEWEAKWLPGYRNSKPVVIGNRASDQLQLDTFGEVLDGLYHARCNDIYPHEDKSGASLEVPLLEHLEKIWNQPDCGLWEFRGAQRFFTQSQVMAWVAFDRGVRMVEEFGCAGPVERWRKVRDTIHAEVCKKGFHRGMKSFTQSYGSRDMDASLLMLPLVGFLPAGDERITGTVRAVEKHLMRDGLVWRYDTRKAKDGLPPGEGAFLACNFWLVSVYARQGRLAEATALFERLLSLSNNLKLLSEEYDPRHGLIGNFPQAFSHIGLIQAALELQRHGPLDADRTQARGN